MSNLGNFALIMAFVENHSGRFRDIVITILNTESVGVNAYRLMSSDSRARTRQLIDWKCEIPTQISRLRQLSTMDELSATCQCNTFPYQSRDCRRFNGFVRYCACLYFRSVQCAATQSYMHAGPQSHYGTESSIKCIKACQSDRVFRQIKVSIKNYNIITWY